jgi:hypothetical protein
MTTDSVDARTLRNAALATGAVTAAFGIASAVFSGQFARLVGVPAEQRPTATRMLRAVGIFDTATGLALAAAAARGGNIAPWLLLRTLWEGSASLLIGWTVVRGQGNGALATVGLLAFGTSAIEALLWRGARRVGRPRDER